MSDCPRCYGSPAVVCCALCSGSNNIPKTLADKHYEKSLRRWPSVNWCKAERDRV